MHSSRHDDDVEDDVATGEDDNDASAHFAIEILPSFLSSLPPPRKPPKKTNYEEETERRRRAGLRQPEDAFARFLAAACINYNPETREEKDATLVSRFVASFPPLALQWCT